MYAASAPSPEVQRTLFPMVYTVLEQAIADGAFPGCAFGLFAENRILLLDSLGRQTYDEDAPAITPTTVYDIASVSKVVATTAAAMLLHQRGQFELDLPLGELLPGFFIGRTTDADFSRCITMRHLLGHSSGLPGYHPLYRTCHNAYQLLRATLKLPIEAEPGTRVAYSDHGFMLLGKAIEVITGEPLSTWIEREITAPLGLSATCYCPPHTIRAEIPPTEKDLMLRHRILQGEVQDEHCWLLGGTGGHAGLFSNVPDLLTFAQEILEPNRLFTLTTVELFGQRQEPEGSSRALGWDTPSQPSSSGRYFSKNSIGHLGYAGTSLWIDRTRRLAAVLLTNRTWPDRSSQKIREIRPAFHDALHAGLAQ